jgi:hypothetical protein
MDVLDRYLETIRDYLPRGAREDFVAELRENIRSQVEDREAQLGRNLTEDERIAILRAHGHPLLVAGAYRSDGSRLVLGREVVGPDLFPFYRLALLGVAAISALVVVFTGAAAMVEGAPRVSYFRTAVANLAILTGIVTLGFALLDAWFRRTARTWDPRKLRAAKPAPPSPARRRAQAALQIVATLAFLWIWIAVNRSPSLRGTHLEGLRLGPGWRLLYVGLTVSSVISLATPVLTLVKPDWHRFGWLVSLFSSGAFIAFASASLWTGDWVVPATLLDAFRQADLRDGINRGFAFGIAITVVVVAMSTVFEVARGAWKEHRRSP